MKLSKSDDIDSILADYGGLDTKLVEAERARVEQARQFDRTEIRPKSGINTYRFLPAKKGSKTSWVRITFIHKLNLPGKKFVTFTCPLKESGTDCPACAHERRLIATGSPVDFDEAKGFHATIEARANVIDRDVPHLGPRVLLFGAGIYNDLDEILDNENKGGNFTHPTQGFDILIDKSGEGLNTNYDTFPKDRASPTPIHDDPAVMREWLDACHDLNNFVRVPTLDDIRSMMRGETRTPGGRQLPARS